MNKVEKFLHEVNALQEEYGLYIISDQEHELFVSIDRSDNQSTVVCLTGDYTIKEYNKNKGLIVTDLLVRISDD